MNTIILSISLFLSINLAAVVGDGKLLIKVINHVPCSKGSDSIKLPNLQQAPVVADTERGEGCYKIQGGVIKVLKPIKGKIYAYTEIKNGTTVDPTECRNYDSNNCGGSGSCIYCDICSQSKTINKAQFRLQSTTKDVNCEKGFDVGEYKDESLSFCMPDEDTFLKSQHIDKAAWKQFAAAQGTTIFCTVYFYTEDISKWSQQKLRDSVKNNESLGCHKIVMNIKSSDS